MNIFRKSALEQIASPEQLDRRVVVVARKEGLAFSALALLVAAALMWGFFGTIAEKVSGTGILLYGDGIVRLTASTNGAVDDISVQTGDYIEKGQTFARISVPEAIAEMDRLRRNLDALNGIKPDGTVDLETVNYEVYSRFAAYLEDAAHLRERLMLYGRELRDELDAALAAYTASSEIKANASGTILSVDISKGDYIENGRALASIAKESKSADNVVCVMYVPIGEGKKVREGMEVEVSPSTVNRSEYGYIIGRIISVSDYSVSREAIMNTLQDEILTDTLAGSEAVAEVRVELLRDRTVSGFKWSTVKGAPVPIEPGTIVSGQIRVASSRPIDLLF
jgi:multidrug resistance efflux pump